MRSSLLPVVVAFVSLPAVAAPPAAQDAESMPTSAPSKAVEMSREPAEGGLQKVTVDLDGDGKAEVTNFVRPRTDGPDLVLRKDVDLNRDGRIDVRTTFDDGGLRVDETMDQDFDGRADWIDHYIAGRRSYAEVDTDFDGVFDLFKYYEGGVVRRKERDTNHDGRIDAWEYLDEKGSVVKTGRDTDGDGKMDVRE